MGIKRKSQNTISRDDVSEQLLQQNLRGWKSNPKYILENLYVFNWESDFLVKTRSGYWYEVECKISLADFKNDFVHKWQKHELMKTGVWYTAIFLCRTNDEKELSKYEPYQGYYIQKEDKAWNVYIRQQSPNQALRRSPNYFSYCVPWYLGDKVLPLIPEYVGLIVLTEDGKLNEIKTPKKLHTEKYTDEELKLCEKFYYAYRNWKENSERIRNDKEIKRLRNEISFLKAEHRAVAGCDIKEVF